ncbi:hypothetical protein [Pedobacter frigiditerrae]|uniref:hypothetical protein n=1 Tax=Pedobacter frigiditerrae TaxID=2530452 RepID=UPI00292D59CA|nr:hypothetical protein [Pedobacter frigiditerrae]
MKKNLILFIATLLLLTSCQKDIVFPDESGSGTGTKPNSEVFTLSGTRWNLTASTTSIDYGGTIFEADLFALFAKCAIDDIHIFNANGTATDDQGIDKCDPTGPQTVTNGTWKLSSDKKVLTLATTVPNAAGITTLDADVLQMDATTLKVKYITYANGPKATTITTYKRAK